MSLSKRAVAEFLGTFWLVFGGCGSAVLAAAFPALGIGFVGVALAFGLTVLTMAYAIGHISGCHLNPAISVGLVVGKRFSASDLPAYVVAQVAGAIAAAGVLYVIASGKAGFDLSGGFASNGYGEHSPGGYSLVACLVAEVVLTLFFLLVIMGSTDRRAPAGFAPIAIGLCLTLIHLIGIPVTNLSVNPARSTGPAIFVGGWALGQLWLFWVAPIIGGALGGGIYRAVFGEPVELRSAGGTAHLRGCEEVCWTIRHRSQHRDPIQSHRTRLNGAPRRSFLLRFPSVTIARFARSFSCARIRNSRLWIIGRRRNGTDHSSVFL